MEQVLWNGSVPVVVCCGQKPLQVCLLLEDIRLDQLSQGGH